MNINIKDLKIQKNGRFITFKIWDWVKEYPTSFVITKDEWTLAKESILGKRTFHPYFSDISYLVCFASSKINVAYKDKREEETYIFPVWEIIETVDLLIKEDQETQVELKEYIPLWKGKYAPNIKFYWGEKVEEAFQKDIVSELVTQKDDLLKLLETIASHHSDGNLIKIHVNFDNCKNAPINDYYWSIVDGERRLYNGGYIAHLVGENQYKYAIHT